MSLRPIVWLPVALLTLFVAVLVTGCGSTAVSDAIPDQRLAYKKQREAPDNLEIPPDLAGKVFDDALDIPPLGGATYSEYRGTRAERARVATSSEVLPDIPNVELKRRDSERWLEVQASPQQVWPRLISFWREQGILLVEQDPAVGVMRTDWLDNRAEIRRDFITRMVSKVMEGIYATSTRDQYSLRIEAGARPGTTEVRMTHRGMEERLVTNAIGDGSRTIWEPSGTDSEKEAEMLRRLMVYLGASQQRAQAAAGAGAGSAPATTGAGVSTSPAQRARLVTEGGVPALVLQEEPRRAWRTIGSALQRTGFAVEDRDVSRGSFYVRYAGQEGSKGGTGLVSKMAFWRKNEVDPVKQYQVVVTGNEQESRVQVLDDKSNPASPETSERILRLLQEEIL